MTSVVRENSKVPRHKQVGLTPGKIRLIEFLDSLNSEERTIVVTVIRGHEPWKSVKLASGRGLDLDSSLDFSAGIVIE